MPYNAVAGASIARKNSNNSYRPTSSVYEIVSPLTTKFQSELDAVHTRIPTISPPKYIARERMASPCPERLVEGYGAELYPARFESIEPDQHTRRSKEEKSMSPNEPERMYGLAPAVFWIVILLIVSLIAAGVAVGLGIGFSRVRGSGDVSCPTGTSSTIFVHGGGNSSPQTEPVLPSTASPTPTSTKTSGSTVSTTSSSAWNSYTNPGTVDSVILNANMPDISCPDHNNATAAFPFYVNGSSLTYQIHCKTNYNIGSFPSVKDIQVIANVQSLASCIQLCSYYTVQLPQGGPRNYSTGYAAFCTGVYFWQNACYLKSGVVSGVTGGCASGDGAMLVRNGSWSN
ncbi:hypothetical protein MMC11_008901 [Xylographa trunciseda]|nr:hypothetical protein [Xylographa trunciseda]